MAKTRTVKGRATSSKPRGSAPGRATARLSEATWYAAAPLAAWRELAKALPFIVDEKSPHDLTLDLTILHKVPEEGPPKKRATAVLLSAHVGVDPASIVDESQPVTLHWHLRMRNAPDVEPPHEVVEMSRRLGGSEGLLKTLAAHWPGERELSVACRVRVKPASGERLLKAFAPPKKKVVRPEPDGPAYTLTPSGGVWEVSASHVKKPAGWDPAVIMIFGNDESFAMSMSDQVQLRMPSLPSDSSLLAQINEHAWNLCRLVVQK